MILKPKADRFAFVKYECEGCGETIVQIVRRAARECRCGNCETVRRIRESDYAENPY